MNNGVCVPVSMCFKLIRIKMNERNAKYHLHTDRTNEKKRKCFRVSNAVYERIAFRLKSTKLRENFCAYKMVLVRWNANEKMDHTHHKAISVHQPCIWDVRKYIACAQLYFITEHMSKANSRPAKQTTKRTEEKEKKNITRKLVSAERTARKRKKWKRAKENASKRKLDKA